jgi:hypothetical protein
VWVVQHPTPLVFLDLVVLAFHRNCFIVGAAQVVGAADLLQLVPQQLLEAQAVAAVSVQAVAAVAAVLLVPRLQSVVRAVTALSSSCLGKVY